MWCAVTMAVNITGGGEGGGGSSSAEVRVSTLKIQADRVQADLGDGRALNLAGANNRRSYGQPVGQRATDTRDYTQETHSSRSELNKLQSRCCFGFFAVPFAVVLALLSVGIVTFVLKNKDATENCKFNCSLVCTSFLSSSLQPQEACYAAYASGSVASLVTVTLVCSLLVKICLGSKM